MEWEKEQAILMNQDLAKNIGRAMWFRSYRLRRAMPLEDCVGEAAYALVYAANHFDWTQGKPFAAYAQQVIRNHLKRLYNGSENVSIEYSYTEVDTRFKTSPFGDEESSFLDSVGDDDTMLDMVETLEAVSSYLQKCNEKEQTLFALRLEGYSKKECALELVRRNIMPSCSQPAVSWMLSRMQKAFHIAFAS